MRHQIPESDVARRLEDLFRTEGPRLWRSLLLCTGSREVADDAVAEAFAQALQRGERIRNPSGWVWRVAFQLARAEMQRQRTQVEIADTSFETPETVVDLKSALAKLSHHQRVSIVLAEYAGYPHREIARLLGSSIAAVGVHVYRARHRLRDLLKEA